MGCQATLVTKQLVKDLKKKSCGRTKWNTKAGSLSASQKVKCKFTLPEFFENRDLDREMYVDESDMKCNYDMIVGRDLMDAIGLDILFSKGTMIWDNSEVPMKPYDSFENLDHYEQEVMMMHDPNTTESERIQQILDAKSEIPHHRRHPPDDSVGFALL